MKKLLQDRVLLPLSWAEANNRLGFDLDLFAGLRIAADARLAVRLHTAANPRNDDLPGAALGFLHRQLVQLFKEKSRLLLRSAEFLRNMSNNLRLAEWLSCHLFCLSS